MLLTIILLSQELEEKREEYRAAQIALDAAEREQEPLLAGLAARGALHRDEMRGVRAATDAAARALRLEEEEVADEERAVHAKVEVFLLEAVARLMEDLGVGQQHEKGEETEDKGVSCKALQARDHLVGTFCFVLIFDLHSGYDIHSMLTTVHYLFSCNDISVAA